jgi:hypothetical protein
MFRRGKCKIIYIFAKDEQSAKKYDCGGVEFRYADCMNVRGRAITDYDRLVFLNGWEENLEYDEYFFNSFMPCLIRSEINRNAFMNAWEIDKGINNGRTTT